LRSTTITTCCIRLWRVGWATNICLHFQWLIGRIFYVTLLTGGRVFLYGL
jgi:hypothetical protein